jgi:hypothetical protein
MIRVTVEQIDGDVVRPLATATIDPVGAITNADNVGDYAIQLSRFGRPGAWKTGRLTGFPRRVLGGWDLVFRCLDVMVGFRDRKEPEE